MSTDNTPTEEQTMANRQERGVSSSLTVDGDDGHTKFSLVWSKDGTCVSVHLGSVDGGEVTGRSGVLRNKKDIEAMGNAFLEAAAALSIPVLASDRPREHPEP